jgi:hypothetical protein
VLTTTFAKLKAAGACESGYRKLSENLGGILKYGKETPITFLQIMESNGLDDTLWAFCAANETEAANRIARLFAANCAEHVLPIFEKHYPEDKRPRKAVEAARLYAVGAISAEDLAAARAAARAAAWDAGAAAREAARAAAGAAAREAARAAAGAAAWDAGAAAGAAAWDAGAAAGAAEEEWQKETLVKLLIESGEGE